MLDVNAAPIAKLCMFSLLRLVQKAGGCLGKATAKTTFNVQDMYNDTRWSAGVVVRDARNIIIARAVGGVWKVERETENCRELPFKCCVITVWPVCRPGEMIALLMCEPM